MTKESYHDKGYKLLLSKKHNFAKFLRHFVNNQHMKHVDVDESSLRLCNQRFADPFSSEMESNELEPDLVYWAKMAGRDVCFYTITKVHSTVDFTMPYRVLQYIWKVLERAFNNAPEDERTQENFRLPLVIPIIFYNGEEEWSVPCNFKDYLQGGYLMKGAIDFQYTLVDINHLDSEYLLKNHDAICAAIAVDKVRDDYEQLFNIILKIVHSKSEFDAEEFEDFLTWLKHTLKRRTGSEEEADRLIGLIEEGDEAKMRTGIDILFDNHADYEGIIRAALRLLKSGLDMQEVSARLEMSAEQIEQVETRAGLKTRMV